MQKRKEVIILLIADALMICGAWHVYFLLRVRSGLVPMSGEPEFWAPMIFIYLFWLLTFWIVGLYRPWYAASRLDELALIFKTSIFGCAFLFFAIFVDDEGQSPGVNARMMIAAYWAIVLVAVSTGRMVLRGLQRRLLIAGIGARNTIIIGDAKRSRKLYHDVRRFPALGYRISGFVRPERRTRERKYEGVPVFGSVGDLPRILRDHEIREVLIALDSGDHERLVHVIAQCSAFNVGLKIVPDLYDIISGQARTNQIYGFPLIEISTQLMPPWEEATKRIIDVVTSAIVLLIGLPIWLLVALAVKIESRGPVFYRQERMGRDGEPFKIIKFRSMRRDAEQGGAQWARKKDPRVTRVGFILRKLHIDEFPQALNVLKGEMSLVGPRPERPVFVEKLSKEIPLYRRRLKVRPGITGWAQVKHKYDESIEDVRKKVEYDLYYIENMSLRMDFKIIINTLSHMLLWRGH